MEGRKALNSDLLLFKYRSCNQESGADNVFSRLPTSSLSFPSLPDRSGIRCGLLFVCSSASKFRDALLCTLESSGVFWATVAFLSGHSSVTVCLLTSGIDVAFLPIEQQLTGYSFFFFFRLFSVNTWDDCTDKSQQINGFWIQPTYHQQPCPVQSYLKHLSSLF